MQTDWNQHKTPSGNQAADGPSGRRGGRPAVFWPVVLILLAAGGIGVAAYRGHLSKRRRDYAERSSRYDPLIQDAARRHGIAPLLVKAVIWNESRFKQLAVGGAGEVGLMQITDGAIADWRKATGKRVVFRGLCFIPRLNIEIGTWYLARALDHWRGYRDAHILALAEYNAGRERAKKWAPDRKEDPVPLKSIRLPGTREYIRKVTAKWRQLEKEQRAREQRTPLSASDPAAGRG